MSGSNMFTNDPGVIEAVDNAVKATEGRTVSDVIDDDGHQYVDLVMEGGGVLGIALLGYTYTLERCGIRFFGIGGTSAGSITALLLAAWDDRQNLKSAELAAELADFDLSKVVDGDEDVKDFINTALGGAGWFRLVNKGIQVIDTLVANKGLNPGLEFLSWIGEILDRRGIKTTDDLLDRVKKMPESLRSVGQPVVGDPQLAIVAAEIRTETRVDFPRLAPLFWESWQTLNPAYFVRASMSVPLFFEPLVIDRLPYSEASQQLWETLCWAGEVPTHAVLVDGGIMSNFPIDLFHTADRIPSHPTFGAKLGIERSKPHKITGPHHVVSAAFTSARHTLDTDFILRNPDYRQLLTYIDTGDHFWLDFSLGHEAQVDLFRRGAEAAADFIETFDWGAYKELRGDVAKAVRRSEAMESVVSRRYRR